MRTLSIAVLILFLYVARSESHEWTDLTGGYKVKATLISVADGKAKLLTAEKQEVDVPIEKLSRPDQKRVQAWLDTRDGTPPKLPENSAVLFNFLIKTQNIGQQIVPNIRGFAVEWKDSRRPALLTTTWAFSNPALGIDLANLKDHVAGLSVRDATTRKPIAKGNETLPLTGIAEATPDDSSNDLAAFLLDPKTRVGAFGLADESPQVGELVWLVSLPELQVSEESSELKIVSCKVEEHEEKSITFMTADGEVPPNTLSSPIVNFAGEVVGMFTLRGGKKGTIVAMRVEDIRAHLEAATTK